VTCVGTVIRRALEGLVIAKNRGEFILLIFNNPGRKRLKKAEAICHDQQTKGGVI